MALRIITAAEPMKVETIVLTIYAPPGVGKTSLASSADSPLLLDTDNGAYRSAFRKDVAPAREWADIAGITAADVKPYRTLVLDTAGRALDLLAADIIRRDPKMGYGGALALKGFGRLKSEFIGYLNLMRSFGLDIVLIAHATEKMQGDDTIDRIDMQGASKDEVYKSTDAMARLAIVGGGRVLSFSPTDTQFGKDPAGLGKVEVPDLNDEPLFLAGLIERIKSTLNAESEQQREAAEKFAAWKARCDEATTAEALTALIPEASNRREKEALLTAATSKGFEFSAGAGAFVVAEPDDTAAEDAGTEAEPAPTEAAAEPEKPKPERKASGQLVTEKQRKRFYAIAHEAGFTHESAKRMLAEKFRIGGTDELTRDIYEDACEMAADSDLAEQYADQPDAFAGVA